MLQFIAECWFACVRGIGIIGCKPAVGNDLHRKCSHPAARTLFRSARQGVCACFCMFINMCTSRPVCLFMRVTGSLILYGWKKPNYVAWHEFVRYVTCLTFMVGVSHDAFTRTVWLIHVCVLTHLYVEYGEVGGWGRDPKKCTGRGWGMGSKTI